MVLAAKFAPACFASDKNGPEVIGRWAAGLCPRPLAHRDISAETPVRGELWLGFAAHYLTGIVLTQVYLAAAGRGACDRACPAPSPTEWPPAVLPLLLMYPSMGYGCCGRKSGDAPRLVCSMLAGHAGSASASACGRPTRRTG